MCLTGGAITYNGQPELSALREEVRKRLTVGRAEHSALCRMIEMSSRVEVHIGTETTHEPTLAIRVSFLKETREELGWILLRVEPKKSLHECTSSMG